MQDLLSGFASTTFAKPSGERVTLADIETRLRSISSGAQQAVSDSKQNALAAGILSGALVLAGAYLHGRRRGRRRATVLEIRRV